MSKVRWISSTSDTHNQVSTKACAVLFLLMLGMDEGNEVVKGDFLRSVSWIKDPRTGNKYWNELVDKGVLVHLRNKTWMVSPHECYAGNAAYNVLIIKWDVANLI